MKTTPYEMCIANAATFIQSAGNKINVQKGEGIGAFTISIGIAAGFCKSKEKVLMDILNYKVV